MNQDKPIRILREPQVFERTGLSKTTRWRLEKQNQFPKKIQISKKNVGWREDQINDWLMSRLVVGAGT